MPEIVSLPANTFNEPVADYLDQLFHDAITLKASDIHLEPQSRNYRIRLRIDGLLQETAVIPVNLAARLITRLKILSSLNIAEKRLPQDGRLPLPKHENIDVRINTCPTLHGEKIALRLLNNHAHIKDIHSLGMSPEQQSLFKQALAKHQGLIIIAGPTGSGKTITLYTALHYLNDSTKHIATVEDPIEIELPGINQTAIHPQIGFTFANALRTLLRQDPDILMIGEIRDHETASIALQAAQTGHLVLTTLHANQAASCIERLNTIGIETDQLAHSLTLIIAQRLIRKKCIHCACLTPDCTHCRQGYTGRTGIFECLANVSTRKIHGLTLHEAGMQKVQQGITTLEEITRVLN